MNKGFIFRMFVVVGAAACALAAPGRASACGGGDWEFVPAVDYRPKGLDVSEKEIQEGKIHTAAARVIRMFPELRKAKLGVDPKIDRAYRILALASARSSGSLAVDREVPRYIQDTWLGKTASEQRANLDWSVATLRDLNAKKKDDPSLQSELGEALVKAGGHDAEALALLGKLADKDLLASPEAYGALAEARGRSGDSAGREVAIKKCEAMAKSKDACGRAPLAGTPGSNGHS
jgi:hypothetical protein